MWSGLYFEVIFLCSALVRTAQLGQGNSQVPTSVVTLELRDTNGKPVAGTTIGSYVQLYAHMTASRSKMSILCKLYNNSKRLRMPLFCDLPAQYWGLADFPQLYIYDIHIMQLLRKRVSGHGIAGHTQTTLAFSPSTTSCFGGGGVSSFVSTLMDVFHVSHIGIT